MKLREAIVVFVGVAALSCSWAAPIVSNVRMQQIEGTKDVRITYDLADNVNTQLWMDVSVNPKATVVNWGTGSLPLTSVEGDVFRMVAPGRDRSLIWHAGVDWNGRFTDMAQAIVRAKIPNNDYGACPDRSLVFSADYPWLKYSWYDRFEDREYHCARAYESSEDGARGLSTKVMGPGTISFYWYMSATSSSYVSLYLYVDGTNCKSCTSTSLSYVDYEISSPGLHTIVWTFKRGSSDRGKYYYAYVGDVVWHESP